jgi:hypothetical protein
MPLATRPFGNDALTVLDLWLLHCDLLDDGP